MAVCKPDRLSRPVVCSPHQPPWESHPCGRMVGQQRGAGSWALQVVASGDCSGRFLCGRKRRESRSRQRQCQRPWPGLPGGVSTPTLVGNGTFPSGTSAGNAAQRKAFRAASAGVRCKGLRFRTLQLSPSCPTSPPVTSGGKRREAMPPSEDLAGLDPEKVPFETCLLQKPGESWTIWDTRDLRSHQSAVLEDALPVTERLAVFRTRRGPKWAGWQGRPPDSMVSSPCYHIVESWDIEKMMEPPTDAYYEALAKDLRDRHKKAHTCAGPSCVP